MEVEEGLERISGAVKVCQAYQDCFFVHRDKLQSYQVANTSFVPDWSFDPILVFARLQRFLQHIDTLQVVGHELAEPVAYNINVLIRKVCAFSASVARRRGSVKLYI